jgi:hypothetical protein
MLLGGVSASWVVKIEGWLAIFPTGKTVGICGVFVPSGVIESLAQN